MAKKYLDYDGLLYLWQKIKNVFTVKADSIKNITRSGTTFTATRADGTTFTFTQQDNNTTYSDATTSAAGLMSASDKTKLNGIASGAEVNQNAFSNVKVGNTTIAADSKTDTLTFAGSGYATVGYSPSEKKVTINVGVSNASTSQSGLMSSSHYRKLEGIDAGAEVNQNAFSNVKVGSTTVAADGKTDTLELVAGSNITLTPDATNDKITIAATDTTYSDATTSAAGLMSAADKTKLDGIASWAEPNQYAFSNVRVGETTVAADSKTDTLELVAGSNVTLTPDTTNDKVTIAATDTTYSNATTSAAGLMSASDKTKFNTISNGGTAGQVWATTGSNSTAWRTLTASDVSAIPTSAKGAASGVCPLNASSKIDSTYLPSFVDDVVEAYARSGQTALSQNWLATGSATGTVITPEAGKIYILMAESGDYSANTQFRWSGTTYVKLNDGGVSAITNAEIDTIVAT